LTPDKRGITMTDYKFKIGETVRVKKAFNFIINDYTIDKLLVVDIEKDSLYPIICELIKNNVCFNRMGFKEEELEKYTSFTKIRELLE
jgi:hypothetical protein